MKRAVIYARVSTSDQDPDNQVQELRAWAGRMGLEILASYTETESAWRDGHQTELAEVLRRATWRRFDTILVWSLDRLSREGPLAILSLVNTFNKYGVRILSYQEPWTEAPGELGSLLYAIAGWVAEWESRRRSERTKAGLKRAQASGQVLGRPPGSKDKRKRKTRRD